MFHRWLCLFRAVNLPTVPGDVLAGAAALVWAGGGPSSPAALAGACLAALGLYLFGMADNDLVGAQTDGPARPIPRGDLTAGQVRVARALCLLAALGAGLAAALPPLWWYAASALLLAIVVYNRTKSVVAMGLCRGLNVVCGAAALAAGPPDALPRAGVCACAALALVWTLYIALVTRYARGEEAHPERRARVGLLLGALVYLQLSALLVFTLAEPAVRPLLLTGALLLVALRLFRRFMPGVSAS